MKNTTFVLHTILCGFTLFGCEEEGTKTTEDTVDTTDTATHTEITWYGDIQPFVADNCAVCHNSDGVAPLVFEQYEDVQILAPVMLQSMQSKTMPPWLPSQDCLELQHPRVLSEEQISHFADWIAQDTPMGDPSLGISDIPEIQNITATRSFSMPAGFTPQATSQDQYRCFVLDAQFTEETFITQTQVIPGSNQVHHVLIYALAPEMRGAVEQANGADGEIGYSCFGDPFPANSGNYDYGFPTQIGAWVPGLEPAHFPENVALRVKPNSPIIMQIHYSALSGENTEDSTSYHIVTSDTAPEFVASTRPLAVQKLDIPAGESSVSATDTFTNYYDRPVQLASMATHMHLLGKSQYSSIHRSDGTEECLFHIPDWDFAWQQSYKPAETLWIEPGETIEVTCTYDNSSANQPFVNGEQQAPRDVQWGDGTLDEMCLLYTTTIDPYRPLPPAESPACYGIEQCVAECGESLDCIMGCESVEFSCLTCTLDVFLDCGVGSCVVPALQAQECLRGCYAKSIMMGSTIGACLEYECPTEYDALLECATPVMLGETCASGLASCGVRR